MKPALSVFGLGKLGAPLAACCAAKGFRVIGVDADPRKIEAVEQRRSPVFEPGLTELIQSAQGRLSATQDAARAVAESQITFIVVPTPSEAEGSFSLGFVLPVCEAIGRALAEKTDFHLVCLTSTVMPGTTGGAVREVLEAASGKRCGAGFGLCYSPEFIALGSVIRDFLNPDFLLIGESDPQSGARLEALYREVCENRPAVARMNFVNAELAKLAVNTYVTTKISFANMLARVCERLPGADVDEVTRAIALDSRIGAKYLRGAISYGGPCFPRDNLAFTALARQLDAPAHLAETTDQFNRMQIGWLAGLVESHLPEEGTAGILGLTYKPDTDVVEQAVGLLLAQELMARGARVLAFDPVENQAAVRRDCGQIALAANAEECIAKSAVVVLATPWPEFRKIPAERWSSPTGSRVVIDCWRALASVKFGSDVIYLPLGTAAVGQAPGREAVARKNSGS